VTFGPQLRIRACYQENQLNHMIRRLELSVSTPNPWRQERGWRLNQSPITNDLISHVYLLEKFPKG